MGCWQCWCFWHLNCMHTRTSVPMLLYRMPCVCVYVFVLLYYRNYTDSNSVFFPFFLLSPLHTQLILCVYECVWEILIFPFFFVSLSHFFLHQYTACFWHLFVYFSPFICVFLCLHFSKRLMIKCFSLVLIANPLGRRFHIFTKSKITHQKNQFLKKAAKNELSVLSIWNSNVHFLK